MAAPQGEEFSNSSRPGIRQGGFFHGKKNDC